MKPSEAMRIGMTLATQIRGRLVSEDNGRIEACAAGAIFLGALGVKRTLEGHVSRDAIRDVVPMWHDALESRIMMMNDADRMSFEDIARNLESEGL
jgi:hypothetical protein